MINKCIELQPKNGDAFYFRGICKFALGDKISSCADWTKANKLGQKDAAEEINTNCQIYSILITHLS